MKNRNYDQVFFLDLFEFSIYRGILNLGFVDYEKTIELIYKHSCSFAFDELTNRFTEKMRLIESRIINEELRYSILNSYNHILGEIISKYGVGIINVINYIEKHAEELRLYNGKERLSTLY